MLANIQCKFPTSAFHMHGTFGHACEIFEIHVKIFFIMCVNFFSMHFISWKIFSKFFQLLLNSTLLTSLLLKCHKF